jgi:hypothetical protein
MKCATSVHCRIRNGNEPSRMGDKKSLEKNDWGKCDLKVDKNISPASVSHPRAVRFVRERRLFVRIIDR